MNKNHLFFVVWRVCTLDSQMFVSDISSVTAIPRNHLQILLFNHFIAYTFYKEIIVIKFQTWIGLYRLVQIYYYHTKLKEKCGKKM